MAGRTGETGPGTGKSLLSGMLEWRCGLHHRPHRARKRSCSPCLYLAVWRNPARSFARLSGRCNEGWTVKRWTGATLSTHRLADIPPAWRYVDRQPDTNALEYAAQVYRRMAALEAADPLRLQFDDEAQTLFERWLTDLEQRIRGEEVATVMQAHLAKYRSLMPSLALLFALADGHTECVPISQAKLACDWCDYLETHANRVYSAQARPEQHAAIALSKRLANGWKREDGFFTVRDVYRSGWTALDSPDAARGALQMLVEYGWVKRETDAQTPGRPSETYRINPRIGGTHAGK